MEKMDVYFVKTKSTGDKSVNKELDFTKAQHVMLSFGYKISDRMNLKIEPYIQFLHDVPVMLTALIPYSTVLISMWKTHWLIKEEDATSVLTSL